MKKIIFIPLFFFCFNAQATVRRLLDRSVMIVQGSENREVICESDIRRLSIDGRKRTVDDIIFDTLLWFESIRLKAFGNMDDTTIKNMVKRTFKITDQELEQICKNIGLSVKEGLQELRKLYARNGLLDQIIRSRLFIPKQDVQKYFDAHPRYIEASFLLEIGIIPFEEGDKKEQRQQIIKDIKSGTLKNVHWQAASWLDESEIAEERLFITKMKPGQITKPFSHRMGFEVIRLKEKKAQELVPLEKRYHEIVAILQEPKFNKMLDQYKKRLLDSSAIVFLDDSLKQASNLYKMKLA